MSIAKLHYFKGRGRAETTRWMLAINNVDFINVSLENHNDFETLKSTDNLPFNQLPLLELDGLNLSQSSAMVSFLARKGDFYGDTDEDAVLCDMVVGAVGDFNIPAMQFPFKADEQNASSDLDASLTKFGKHFETVLKRNDGDFVLGQKLSVADVILAESLTSFIEFAPACLGGYPLLQKLQQTVVSEPSIKNYLISANRWRLPDDQYVIDIARVLCRALPPHMPEPERFVNK